MRAQIGVVALALALDPSPVRSAVYDRAITLFSPKGDLMQVSYAEQAVQRGSLAVAATNGRDAVVVCLERPKVDGDSEVNAKEEVVEFTQDDEEAPGKKSERRGRRRERATPIIYGDERIGATGSAAGVPDDANNQDRKLCEVDEDVYLAFAGISADGRVLASKIRLECQNYRYGMGVAPGIGYIARYVGGLQHRYTRTGGARPFGVSCLLTGFDEDGTPRIFRSEPSGAFAEWMGSAVGKASDKALGKLESVSDLGSLDWRETAKAAVLAALVNGAQSCNVLVLRRNKSDTTRKPIDAAERRVEVGAGESLEVAREVGGICVERFVGRMGPHGQVSLEGLGDSSTEL